MGTLLKKTISPSETDDGALLLSRYYGIFDLGPDAYERALRNEFAPVPPLVLAPQFFASSSTSFKYDAKRSMADVRGMSPR